MPIALVAAGAVGAIGSAAIASSASSKASKAATTAAAANNTLARETYASNSANLNPAIQRGNAAGGYVNDLLGIGGDPAAAAKAFDTFQGSTGYKYQLDQGLGAVNSNAYARGMGDSGATLKALQDRGNSIAQGSFQTYLSNLQGVSNQGTGAASSLAGVGTDFVGRVSANNNAAADAVGNAALKGAGYTTDALKNLINAGSFAYGSSYGAPKVPQPVTPGYGYKAGRI
jgi:hypothetical protein